MRLMAAALIGIALAPVAAAQEANPDAARLRMMLECDAIKSETVRLSCYDQAARRSRAALGAGAVGMRSGTTTVRPLTPEQQFGITPQLQRAQHPYLPKSTQVEEISARVSSATDLGIGMWRLAFVDGSSWRMVEKFSGYRAPRRGDEVTIRKGAMGGYLMYLGDDQSVRVERVR